MFFKITYELKHLGATFLSIFVPKKKLRGRHTSLMYHSVGSRNYNDAALYNLDQEKFEEQIRFLINRKVKFIHFCEGVSNKEEELFSITFDDGFLDNFTNAAPFLLKNKIPFTIFMVSDFIGKSGYLTREQLFELSQNPLVKIGGHGKTHRPLATLTLDEAIEEMKLSKNALEEIITHKVISMSFPHGSYTDELAEKAKELGYRCCGTSIFGSNSIGCNSVALNRKAIFFCETLRSFKQKINGQWDWLLK